MIATVSSIADGDTHVYAAVGRVITHYAVNVQECTLSKKHAVSALDNIQYAWPYPVKACLYAASSDGGFSVAGKSHHLSVFRIDRKSGALEHDHSSVPLRSRPVHMTLDATGDHALVAYHFPAGVSVHRIHSDGGLGGEIKQSSDLDTGIYPHQILVAPSNEIAVVVARGNDPRQGVPEDPGALKFMHLKNGILSNAMSVAPNGGYGFGPRNIDFHPEQRWVFAALERQNKLYTFRMEGGEPVSSPLFVRETLIAPDLAIKNQLVGAVRIHPNGRFLYVINRASGTTGAGGERKFDGGENNIAVFRIDQVTGEPELIQNEDTRGINTRTFSIDPSGKMLVAGNSTSLSAMIGNQTHKVPACLSTFRIGEDGKLSFVKRYLVETGEERLFWMGMTKVPNASPPAA